MLWHYFGNVPFYLENLSEPPYTLSLIHIFCRIGDELFCLHDRGIFLINGKMCIRDRVEYGLIEDGDKILIGLSGGKDSLALVELLARLSLIHICSSTIFL